MDRSCIDKYVAGGQELIDAYQGLTCDQLFAHPIPGTWSLHQIAIHLMESDLMNVLTKGQQFEFELNNDFQLLIKNVTAPVQDVPVQGA